MHQYNDLAIPIAWPDQTARGDELWMSFFKKIGIVKNLNFKVGHAAIVLIERSTGDLLYFDFGRYLTPRGYGRARSQDFDPRLKLKTKAKFSVENELLNFESILAELESLKAYTHGGGRLLCSICKDISFKKGLEYAEKVVNQGPMPYGALAPNNNSCSRFVAQVLVESMLKSDKRIKKILYPESLKASPTSNVINAIYDQKIFCYHNNHLKEWHMSRLKSLKFQVSILKPNFFRSASKELPDDSFLGFVDEPKKPKLIPDNAQWVGGLGEGCWFVLEYNSGNIEISRYSFLGELEYKVACYPDKTFDHLSDYTFSYQIHHKNHTVKQNNEEIVFITHDLNKIEFKKSI